MDTDGKLIYLVQFSTGAGSAEVAWRCIDQHGVDAVHLLTADTLVEDEDNWRFAREVVAALGSPRWDILRDGRTPMEVGRAHRAVPSDRMAICSRVLKRDILRRHIEANYTPESAGVYFNPVLAVVQNVVAELVAYEEALAWLATRTPNALDFVLSDCCDAVKRVVRRVVAEAAS